MRLNRRLKCIHCSVGVWKCLRSPSFPTVPEGHEHRVTTPETLGKSRAPPAEPRRDPAEPSERPRGALSETPAEPSERQISLESLAEGCAPRMVTLRNFKILQTPTPILDKIPRPMEARFFIQCWAGVWHPYRENTSLPNTRTG